MSSVLEPFLAPIGLTRSRVALARISLSQAARIGNAKEAIRLPNR
jgi:hypothetical protein